MDVNVKVSVSRWRVTWVSGTHEAAVVVQRWRVSSSTFPYVTSSTVKASVFSEPNEKKAEWINCVEGGSVSLRQGRRPVPIQSGMSSSSPSLIQEVPVHLQTPSEHLSPEGINVGADRSVPGIVNSERPWQDSSV